MGNRFRYQNNDQELISRFRYLTGKRYLGGFGSPGVARGFDRIDIDLRFWFERHDIIGGDSLGDVARIGGSYRGVTPYDTMLAKPKMPMWWEGEADPDMVVVRDHEAVRKAQARSWRFYQPRAWPGVFPEGSQERHEREQREKLDREEKERAEQRRKANEEARKANEEARARAVELERTAEDVEIRTRTQRETERTQERERIRAAAERARIQRENEQQWAWARNFAAGWNYNGNRPASNGVDEHGELLANMRLNEPLSPGQGRIWNNYVMILESDFTQWQSDPKRSRMPEVCRGHGKIIFRMH